MPAQTEPRSGLLWGWNLGESGWKPGMDANLLRLGRFGFHLSVKDRDLNAAPGAPAAGDTYIVGGAPTGTWAGHAGHVAIWDGAAWQYGTPRTGWAAYLEDEQVRVVYRGGAWAVESPAYTDEQVRDVIGAALVAGTGIGITVNDAGDTITVASNLDKALVSLATAANSHSTSAWAKIPIDNAEFDTNSIWDATNKRFVPKKAGYYHVDMRVRRNTSAPLVAGVGKNGLLHRVLGPDAGSMYGTGGSALVYCNGTTDYLEPFCYSTSAIAYTTGTVDTYMSVVGPF